MFCYGSIFLSLKPLIYDWLRRRVYSVFIFFCINPFLLLNVISTAYILFNFELRNSLSVHGNTCKEAFMVCLNIFRFFYFVSCVDFLISSFVG